METAYRRGLCVLSIVAVLLLPALAWADSAPAQPQWFVKGAKPSFNRIGSLDQETGYLMQLNLDSRYASIYTLKLSKHFDNVKAKRQYKRDPKAYVKNIEEHPELKDGMYSVLNPVDKDLPLATMKVTATLEGQKSFKALAIDWQYDPKLSTSDENSQSISYVWVLLRGTSSKDAKPVLQITKTYTVFKKDYSLRVDLKLENMATEPLTVEIDQRGPTGLAREDARNDGRLVALGELEEGHVEVITKKKSVVQDLDVKTPQILGKSNSSKRALWIGQVNKYFGSMLYLLPKKEGNLAVKDYVAEFYYQAGMESADSKTQVTGVFLKGIRLAAAGTDKATEKISMDVFAGPKRREMFADSSAEYFKQQYKDLRYIDTIHFECFCTVSWLTLGMMWMLSLLSYVTFGNYGIAIFLLVVLVRVVLHPLTKKSQVSMMKMQKFGPEMEKLKKKYADDKNTLNKEMMKFYKEHGASPFLGCLPMFLQMPIWIALWTSINASVDLRHAAFLPVWITDLSAPDALLSWGKALPMIGTSLNLLPILMAVPMFLQTKLNPQMAGGGATTATTPEQQQMQKMMKYMFPLMMPVILYNAPSGVSLYILTSTVAGIVEQMVIRKHIKQKQEAEEAAVTRVDLPGKAFRDSRPKKPKGPGFKKPF